MTATAARISPSTYAVKARRIETGLEFATPAQAFRVVGDPITTGSMQVSVRVREVGGTHDGNEFAAYLYATGE